MLAIVLGLKEKAVKMFLGAKGVANNFIGKLLEEFS